MSASIEAWSSASRGEIGIESLQGLEEAILLFTPGAWLGGVPTLLADGGAQGPLKQIAHVGKDLHGSATGAGETRKVIWGSFKGTGSAVGEGGDGVTQQFAFCIHAGTIAQSHPRWGRRSRWSLAESCGFPPIPR